MANLGMTVNVDEIPERDDFSPIAAGTYTGMIVDSEMKENSKGTGEYLQLEIEIQGGEYAGRKLFERLNIKNSNDKAVEIAFKTLGEIIRAVGKKTIKDSNELHNKKLSLDIVVDPAKPYQDRDGNQQAGTPQNRIKRYNPAGGSVIQTSNEQTQSNETSSQAGASASGDSLPPWKRK